MGDAPDQTWVDKTHTFSHNGEQYKATPRQLLMAMARAQRDGASHKAIIAEFDLKGEATSPFILERALATGRRYLDEAIARGEEPAETKVLVDRYSRPLSVNEKDDD